jgi:hypothetical protein
MKAVADKQWRRMSIESLESPMLESRKWYPEMPGGGLVWF